MAGASHPPEPARAGWRVAVLGAALVLAAAVPYLPVASHGFIACDDDRYVYENPVVLEGLSGGGVAWAFTTVHVANWHPLTWLSHMADVELFGPGPGAHHGVNVALHAANTGLLFLALRALSGALWAPALVAALFGLHPLRVESVAWVAERKDVLSGLFFMLALLAYARYARRPGSGPYLAVTVCLALGLLAKPMLVTLPCALLLLDRWPLGRWTAWGDARRLAGLLVEKLPWLGLAAAASAAAVVSQASGRAMGDLATLPVAARLSNAAVAYATYVGKTLWPSGLAVFHPHPALVDPVGYSPLSGAALGSAALLLGLSAFVAVQGRRRPYLAVGWLWYLGMLVPVIGIVQVGDQAWADRYAYLPLIGLYVAVAWGLRDLVEARPRLRVPVAAIAALGLAAFAVVSSRQVDHWRDTRTLFEHALAVTRDNYFAHNHLGRHLENQGDLDGAEREYERALAIQPSYKGAHSNLGNVLAQRGDYEQALAHYEQALRLDPLYAEAYSNAGVAQERRGRPDLAIALYQRAVELDPALAVARRNLGSALLRQGSFQQALPHLERVTELDPGHAGAANDLGVAYARLGRFESAAAAYRRSLALDPAQGEAPCNLGWALENLGAAEAEAAYGQALENGSVCASGHRYLGRRLLAAGALEPARGHLEAVARLRPGDPDAENDLGVLFVRGGDVGRGRVHFTRALRLDPEHRAARRNLRQLDREPARED